MMETRGCEAERQRYGCMGQNDKDKGVWDRKTDVWGRTTKTMVCGTERLKQTCEAERPETWVFGTERQRHGCVGQND